MSMQRSASCVNAVVTAPPATRCVVNYISNVDLNAVVTPPATRCVVLFNYISNVDLNAVVTPPATRCVVV